MKKFLLATLLAIALSIVPLALVGANGDIHWMDTSNIQPLEEGYGTYSEVYFTDMYAGSSGTAPLVIVNGKDRDRIFAITVEKPNNLRRGFEPLPEECYSWISISQNMVPAVPGEVLQIPITITIPNNLVYTNDHWYQLWWNERHEVGIRVSDTTQTGLVQIALQSRWYISSVSRMNITLIIAIAALAIGGGCGAYLLMRRKQKHGHK